MSGDLDFDSASLAEALAQRKFSSHSFTVVGYGNMGKQYIKALLALKVARVRVISQSEFPLAELHGVESISTYAGGFASFNMSPTKGEIGIIATPTLDLVAAADHLVALGYRHLLIEKPISLFSAEIAQLAKRLQQQGVQAYCAFNRVTYPSVYEALARASAEGGITSCTYTFTEFVNRLGPGKFSDAELARWGIANSMHVMSLAHTLIGWPQTWQTYRAGAGQIDWHPTGAIFTGAGLSTQGIPFSYHADWNSTGRWSVEIHTHKSSYRFCPLEQLFRRTAFDKVWEEVPLTLFASAVKIGFVEQVAALVQGAPYRRPPTLAETVALTRFGEEVFGYTSLLPKTICSFVKV